MAEDNTKNIIADLAAEQAVLGSMIIDSRGEAMTSAIEKLKEEDFYREDHRLVYSAIFELYSEGKTVDLITLQEKMNQKGVLDKVGGTEFLVSLVESIPTTANANEYIRIVEEKAVIRKLNNASITIQKLCNSTSAVAEKVVEQAETNIFNVLQERKNSAYIDMKEGMKLTLEKLERLCSQNGKLSGIPTGFIELDKTISGLNKSNLIIIGARPAMGKTAFALNIALSVALNERVPVAVFSLEMGKEELMSRFISSYAEIESNKIKNGTLDDKDWNKIAEVTSVITELPIIISDKTGLNISSLRAQCRKLKLEKNVGLIVIDYIQLMSGTGRTESRQQEISDISRSLKILAKELDIPIIALTQLSRASEKRDDHRPTLSDIRESGAIEQDADLVLFLHREYYYKKDDPELKNLAEVIVAKNRAGETKTVELAWFGEYTKFKNLYKNEI